MTPGQVVTWIKRHGSKGYAAGLATRYGIATADPVAGVAVGKLRTLAKQLGRSHGLALDLWDAGWYETRMLAAFVDEPERVTRGQMDAWARTFDNWGLCDTVCFHLFDRTPFAWPKARQWATSPREFVKRSGFALMASLAGHDKAATEAQFLALLPLIERGATDDRNFVKKGVSWALRSLGRRGSKVRAAARTLAERLAASPDRVARWVGRDGLRDLKR